jgi:hypothetical protein
MSAAKRLYELMAQAEGPFPYRCPPGEIWESGGSNSEDFDYPFGGTSKPKKAKIVPPPAPVVSEEDKKRVKDFYMTDDEKAKIGDAHLKKFGIE